MSRNSQWGRRELLGAGLATGTVLLAGCTSESGTTDSEPTSTDSGEGTDTTGSGGETANNETDSEQNSNEGGGETSAKLGALVEGGDIQFVVRSMEKTTNIGQFSEADEGNTFLVLRMAVKNTSDGFINFSGFWQARVKDGSNHVYNATFAVTEHPLDSDILAAGEVTRGDMVFEVPKDTKGLTLQFDFSAFSLFEYDRVTVDLESKASSAADVEQSLGVPVKSTGEAASQNDVSVTVHGVRTTTSVGSAAEAEDGHEFLIPDIEISNEADEPLSVSSLLQMSVKDGTGLTYGSSLMATSQLDQKYSEGSEIGPGESRRGELAYEVGTDVTTAYWTFNFLDFDSEMKAFWKLKG